MASLTFSKIIFIILIIGVLFTGFIKFGSELSNNNNLDSGTSAYLININSSIQNIQEIQVEQTNISLGTEDSFSKQYKEAKIYANTANGLLQTAGDTPDIMIKTLDINQEENKWFINYLSVGVQIMILIIIVYMLFGRKF